MAQPRPTANSATWPPCGRRDLLRGSLCPVGAGQLVGTESDFTEDARQWQEEFTEFERQGPFGTTAVFWGEDAVATTCPLHRRGTPRGAEILLTTQQVDEARHASFQALSCRRCAALDGSMASGLQTIKPQLTLASAHL